MQACYGGPPTCPRRPTRSFAIELEPGRRYDEQEVNGIVARLFTDHAALRRALVDEGFLARDHGEYWRAGGTVDAH
jgi:hypothetical protein